jgi:hypothetical protein
MFRIESTHAAFAECDANACDPSARRFLEKQGALTMSYTGPYSFVGRAVTPVLAPLWVLSMLERAALADTEPSHAQAACIEAYEGLQEARARDELLSSRDVAFGCASSACPAFMQRDCAAWLEEIESEVPTISFEVQSGGKELTAVRVLEGERLIVDRVDRAAVELDPGVHWLRFEADGVAPVTKPVLLTRGEKNQRFSVELPAAVPASRAQPAGAAPVTASSSSSPAPWIAGGVGLAGLAAFGILSAAGLSQEASLERSCAPSCNDAELRSVRTKYLLADLSLGVGVTGFLLSGYLLLTHGPESQKNVHVASVRVHATPHGGMASVRSAF